MNETAVRQLGFAAPEDIIGRRFRQWDWSGTVIGVVRDYHQHSLRDRISPMTFQMHPELFEKGDHPIQNSRLAGICAAGGTVLDGCYRRAALSIHVYG